MAYEIYHQQGVVTSESAFDSVAPVMKHQLEDPDILEKLPMLQVWNQVTKVTYSPTFAAYALARFKFRGRKTISIDILTLRIFLPIVSVLPIYMLAQSLGMGADIIAVSALLTSSMLEQRDIIKELERMALREKFKVLIGGGAVTEKWAEERP